MDKNVTILINQYVAIIRKNYENIESIYLFGSYAKGKSTDDSDIDLAFVFRDMNDTEQFDIQVQLMLLASTIDTRIEPYPISYEDFHSENPFTTEIKRTGIEIAA